MVDASPLNGSVCIFLRTHPLDFYGDCALKNNVTFKFKKGTFLEKIMKPNYSVMKMYL